MRAALTTSIKNQENITYLVIIVMVIGFLVLLFALASVLITSWQATQSIHDAVESIQIRQSGTDTKSQSPTTISPQANPLIPPQNQPKNSLSTGG